jgi:hypothetical protein
MRDCRRLYPHALYMPGAAQEQNSRPGCRRYSPASAGAGWTPSAPELQVFLVGGKPEVLAQTASSLRQRWQVNIVGTQDGYFVKIS